MLLLRSMPGNYGCLAVGCRAALSDVHRRRHGARQGAYALRMRGSEFCRLEPSFRSGAATAHPEPTVGGVPAGDFSRPVKTAPAVVLFAVYLRCQHRRDAVLRVSRERPYPQLLV